MAPAYPYPASACSQGIEQSFETATLLFEMTTPHLETRRMPIVYSARPVTEPSPAMPCQQRALKDSIALDPRHLTKSLQRKGSVVLVQ